MKDVYVELEKIIKDAKNCYAHSKIGNSSEICYETLQEHTELCQRYFTKICEEKNIEEKMQKFSEVFFQELTKEEEAVFHEMWKNIVTFHDTGKLNPLFQKNIMERKDVKRNVAYNPIGSHHSSLSAAIYMNYYMDKIVEQVREEKQWRMAGFLVTNSYLIARHHSGLISLADYTADLKDGEMERAMKVLEQEYDKICLGEFGLEQSILDKIVEKFAHRKDTSRQNIWLYLYEKLLYSMLVAADYYATSEFNSGVKIENLGALDSITQLYDMFSNTGINQEIRRYEKQTYPMDERGREETKDINVLRKEIFLDAEKALLQNMEKHIYYVEAPTGSGKSNLSMNLSFQLAKTDEALKKIYYVYPFNTLVEQNQEIMEKVFGYSPKLMENIAVINSITPIKQVQKERMQEEEKEKSGYYEYALLNRQFLNYPLILTTHVSVFDTIFGNSKESAFGFHQLAGSIVVLDEIQSYRSEIWGEIITFFTEMAEFLHMKIIIMSATLPDLEELKEQKLPIESGREDAVGAKEDSGETVYLVKQREKYFHHPCFKNRVMINRELLNSKITMQILLDHVKRQCGQGKKILIEFIRKASAEEFYQLLLEEELSESVLCMTGDDSVLERKQIIQQCKEEQGIILVATQVIEAGVDIDMDIGYKSIAKMDSEEQFMGRINRSYTPDRIGVVYFFQMDDSHKIYQHDLRATETFSILQNNVWEFLENKDFPAYYHQVLELWKNIHQETANRECYHGIVKMLDFPKIKEYMQLISEKKWNVSVYLARELTEEDGSILDGRELWKSYKELLYDTDMSYAKRKVKMSEITAKMQYFIYQVQQMDCTFDEQIGELFYIEEGEKFMVNGKLNKEMIQGQVTEFI